MYTQNYIEACFLSTLFCIGTTARAQHDSLRQNKVDSFLSTQKGVLGILARSLKADSAEYEEKDLQRSDLFFQKYRNRIIRNIVIDPIEFDITVADTVTNNDKFLSRVVNSVHYNTRKSVLRNHLFFKTGEGVSPFLMANNERYLRDLPFLQEAAIKVRYVKNSPDSVDVVVYTRDILSVGGSIAVSNSKNVQMRIYEDNFLGLGDRVAFQIMYDKTRSNNFGFGGEYTKRNLFGSFIDINAAYLNFSPAFNSGRREEKIKSIGFIKPLVHPDMRWTYAFSATFHSTVNMFNKDSIYRHDLQYKFRVFDSWAGWNANAHKRWDEINRIRFLVSARFLDQRFYLKPLRYNTHYFYPYANITALLTSFSLFKLNYYKTRYIYGLGRKEDLPEGLEASFIAGWTKKEGRERPFLALSFKRSAVTKKEAYFDYAIHLSSFFFWKKPEDANLLANVDYFSRLQNWRGQWKQRYFFNVSFARQFQFLLNEPLLLESEYGLNHFHNNFAGGKMRTTLTGESVFFSPWRLFYFKFAPFVFSSVSVFQLYPEIRRTIRLYSAFGGGIRTRNESLIFGTIELRGSWFPKKDVFNNNFILQLSTNLRFKYNQDFIRRPDFVSVN